MSTTPTTPGTPPVVTLTSLCDGAAVELFQAELEKVLRNIADPNTDWKTGRKIHLEFSWLTNEDRTAGDVKIKATSKLAGLKTVTTVVYYGRHKGEHIAREHDPKQAGLFDQISHIQAMPKNGGKQ
jgi:hypothetical protein